MNPTLPKKVVDRASERDPAAAVSEYGGEFRTDIESFVSREAIDRATFPDRLELPPMPDRYSYRAFCDPSGGAADSMTIAVALAEGEVSVLDCVREHKPPFSPDVVISDFSRCWAAITSARPSAIGTVEFVVEQFTKRGVTYRLSERAKSDIYRELLPLLNSRRVELLDLSRLSAQLAGLERRSARGGRDSIDHAPGGHDDLINAAGGALVLASVVGSDAFDLRTWMIAWCPGYDPQTVQGKENRHVYTSSIFDGRANPD